MSLGRTGTMWLIQHNLPPLTHTQTHTYGHVDALTPGCIWWFCWNKNSGCHRTSTAQLSEPHVHFLLCYFIDCGHNYPLFWSAALSEFPVCWTISTEGWLSCVIPRPEGTVTFSHTLIIINKPKRGKKKNQNPQLVHLCSGSPTGRPVSKRPLHQRTPRATDCFIEQVSSA